MPYPTPIFEIAFNDSPYAASPTWTDVSSWVRSFSVDRGRSDDWGDFDGSATVVLNNRTRLFDPYYTSGTYYGKLLPRKQIRIRAQTNDSGTIVTHDVFRGFISGWSPNWTDAGTDSTVTLSCFDALQLLASDQLPADWSRNYILSTSPRHYYPCDEPITPYSTTTTLIDLGSVPLNMTTTAAATSGSQLAVGLVNSSITGTASQAANSALGAVGSSPGSFSVSLWAIPDSSGTVSQFLQGYINNHGFSMYYQNSTGKFVVEVTEPSFSNTKVCATDISGWDSGTARMLSFTWNSSTRAITFYIDGLLIATTTTNSAGIVVPFNELVNIGTGSVQQIIVWTGVQTQAVLQEIYKYSTVALGETTSARFQRLIAQTSFPASLTSYPASPASSVLDITDDAPATTQELKLVAASEYAPLFVSKNGTLTLFQQMQQFTQTKSVTSQVTYGTGGSKMGQIFELMPDGDSIRNVANVSMSQGGVYVQENATSVNNYGAASQTVTTQVQTLANAQSIAQLVTGLGGNIYPRLSPIDVVLDSAAAWSPTLALELCDRITVNAQPPSGGNVINVPMLVQSIKHTGTPGYWQTTLEGSARWAAVFIIGQSLIGGTDLIG
jgi:hypothetical protein